MSCGKFGSCGQLVHVVTLRTKFRVQLSISVRNHGHASEISLLGTSDLCGIWDCSRDCAFVGIYGEQDDFAVVLLEDADGEELSISEDLPSAMTKFEPHKAFKAKRHVMKAQCLGD